MTPRIEKGENVGREWPPKPTKPGRSRTKEDENVREHVRAHLGVNAGKNVRGERRRGRNAQKGAVFAREPNRLRSLMRNGTCRLDLTTCCMGDEKREGRVTEIFEDFFGLTGVLT